MPRLTESAEIAVPGTSHPRGRPADLRAGVIWDLGESARQATLAPPRPEPPATARQADTQRGGPAGLRILPRGTDTAGACVGGPAIGRTPAVTVPGPGPCSDSQPSGQAMAKEWPLRSSASRRLTQATAGHAEPSLGCYVLRVWRVSPRGMHPGGAPWAEGRQGHVGCGEAPQGPPVLAHRHRLGLRGERARPARAAGITGGCHGPRVDRARPGSPYRRRKPPTSHPQLAGQPRPRQPLPRPGIGFPAPAGGYPAGRCLRPPVPAGGTPGRARTAFSARW
jgi:hypothetical protein